MQHAHEDALDPAATAMDTPTTAFVQVDDQQDVLDPSDKQPVEPEPVWRDEMREQVRFTMPIVFTFVLEYIPGIVSIALVGHVRDIDAKLCVDAATMATMVSNVTALSVCFGLASALDTLCSQAFGAKQVKAIGIHLQAGVIVLGICLVPILVLNWNTEALLLLVGQDPEVARMAGEFARIALVGIPFMVAYEMLRKVMQTQNVLRPMVVIAVIGNIVNAVGGYLLTYHTSLSYRGAALSRAIGYAVLPLCLMAYILFTRQYRLWWPGWRLREARAQILPFLRLGVPGLLMMVMEWWAYELMALMSGLLPNRVVSISTHSVLINLASTIFMAYVGMSVAASIRVGNSLGANKPKLARMLCRVAVCLVLSAGVVVAVIVLLFRYQLPKFLVNDANTIHNAGKLMLIFAPFTLIDGTNCLLQGICRGIGRQRVAAGVNAFGYYALGIPLSAVFAFALHWGVTGLWVGCCIVGTGTAMVVLIWYLRRVDWDELAQEAIARSTA